jgi:hypothetical protein
MTDIIKPGAGVIFMKVGMHAEESLDRIIARKAKEIEVAGKAFWGYGGNTCHPETMVQPFARSYQQKGGTIYLCMQPMESHHFAVTARADDYSVDGINWTPVPEGINVIGSRYALVIKNLHRETFDLPLGATRVAVGNSMGARGAKYIRGRVDKACLEVTDEVKGDPSPIRIELVAELEEPFAVHVRNRTS